MNYLEKIKKTYAEHEACAKALGKMNLAAEHISIPKLVEAVEVLRAVAREAECSCGATLNHRLEVIPHTCARCAAIEKVDRLLGE